MTTNAQDLQWVLDGTTRLGLFVPTTSDLETALGQARSVYYCPGDHGVIGDLEFDLFLLVQDTVSDRRLAEYFHNSYSNAVKNDERAPAAQRASISLVPARTLADDALCVTVATQPHLAFRHAAFQYVACDAVTLERSAHQLGCRVVRLRVASHHVFTYLVGRFSETSELQIHTQQQQHHHANNKSDAAPPVHRAVLLHMQRPPKRWGPQKPSALHVTRGIPAEKLLLEQLGAVLVDDFVADAERATVKARVAMQRDILAAGLAPCNLKFDKPVSREATTKLHAHVYAGTAVLVSGRVLPGAAFQPRDERDRAAYRERWGKRPPVIEEECATVGAVNWYVAMRQVRLERSFAAAQGFKRAREPAETLAEPPVFVKAETPVEKPVETPVFVKAEKPPITPDEAMLDALFWI